MAVCCKRRVPDTIRDRLADARSRRVVFVSHCLLNENVRFLGGATRAGAVCEVVDPYLRDGVGIVQLPCPEQHAWGGVLKRSMLRLYGRPILRRRAVRRSFVAVARRVTEFEYARLARRAAAEIADYISCGFEVVDVVGVGASPSCGVTTTVDLDGAIAAMAACDRDTLDPTMVNNRGRRQRHRGRGPVHRCSSGTASLGEGSTCRSVSMTCWRSCAQLRSITERAETVRSSRRQ